MSSLKLRDALKLLGAAHNTRAVDALRQRLLRDEKKTSRTLMGRNPFTVTLDVLREFEPALFVKIDEDAQSRVAKRIYRTLADLKRAL